MVWLMGATLVGLLIVAGLAVVSGWRVRQLRDDHRRLEQRVAGVETTASQILEHFRGLSAGAVGQGEHLARLEQNLARLRRRLDQVAAAGGSDGNRFNQAIRMARKGASAREIADTCEISQVEADLVVLLHSQGQEGSNDG